MKLVIVESPAKCGKIAGFLGPGYKVIASMGHIRSLEEALDAVGIDRDFEPRMAFLKEKSKAIGAIKAAAAGVDEVILAADDDREGEAIAYSIAVLLKLPSATTKRAVFHEITKGAVTKAIAEPRLLDMNKVYAQQARSQLDMMIGFTISPLLWRHVARGLSAGRCQTPALRFVIEREREIASHATSTSWKVSGKWRSTTGITFDGHLVDELEDEESVTNYLENLRDEHTATVQSLTVRPWSEAPPQPLITSTLQQVASSLFKSAPKNTMRVAQRLYEAGHITYMRTDKAVLGEEAVAEAQAMVRDTYGPEYVGGTAAGAGGPSKGKKKGAAAEPKAQEAHEAIRPTHFEATTLAGSEWTPLDIKIYKLIHTRALQSVMAPVRGEAAQARFVTADDEDGDLPWSANMRITTFAGWRRVNEQTTADDDASEEETTASTAQWDQFTSLKVGDEVSWTSLQAEPHMSKAAPRYTEATLVRALEQRGIGRPSTFAALLGAIEEKGYVEKKNIEGEKVQLNKLSLTHGQWPPTVTRFQRLLNAERDRLVPTPLGYQVMEFALAHFDDLFAYEFTAAMEERLDKIADGAESYKAVLHDTWNKFKDRYTRLNGVPAAAGAGGAAGPQGREFAGGIKAIITRKGPMLIKENGEGAKATFYTWPQVGGHPVPFEALTEAQVAAAVAAASAPSGDHVGDYEGKPMYKRKGKFGEYVTCGDLHVNWAPNDTPETLASKFAAKASGGGAGPSTATVIGPFTFKTGPYGLYMYKTDLKTRKFVTVPPTIKPAGLTVREADEIYRRGLEAKKSAAERSAAWKKSS